VSALFADTSESDCVGSIATHPCKERKDEAPPGWNGAGKFKRGPPAERKATQPQAREVAHPIFFSACTLTMRVILPAGDGAHPPHLNPFTGSATNSLAVLENPNCR
jgi:hypothetical protein